MAALTADVAVIFDPRYPIGLMQKPATAATYFRGGISSKIAGTELIIKAPAAADFYWGINMERKVAATADLLWCGTSGHFFFTNVLMTYANENASFATLAATLVDNPADIGIATTGTAGTIGILIKSVADASGWINTDQRAAVVNA